MDGDQTADIEFHLHAAARAFWAKKWILCDKHVPLSLRVKFFEAVVTPVACFGAGHRKISQPHLRKFDSEWRRLLRSMVGPPSGLDWSMPWHEVLHSWNQHVQQTTRTLQLQSWSCKCLLAYWNLAHHVTNLPADRWVKRAMSWFPSGARIPGRPRNTWTTHLDAFARFSGIDSWNECVFFSHTLFANSTRRSQCTCELRLPKSARGGGWEPGCRATLRPAGLHAQPVRRQRHQLPRGGARAGSWRGPAALLRR